MSNPSSTSPQPRVASVEPDRTGERINEYVIVREIGRGGYGVVYEGMQEDIGQRVAVKVLAAKDREQSRLRARFLTEARACSRLRHAGIIKIFNYGHLADGTPYILMEYLEGELLRDRLTRLPGRRMPLVNALELVQQIAAAVAVAHEHGIVHRDLKPDNVMIVADSVAPAGERCKIFDFGIARLQEQQETNPGGGRHQKAIIPSGSTTGLGTPAYMAPELFLRGATLDERVDVYALGVMLYEMLCGCLPFVAAPGQLTLTSLQVYQDPTSPILHVPNLPSTVDKLMLRMMDKARRKRPTMREVSEQLDKILAIQRPAPRRARAVAIRGTTFAGTLGHLMDALITFLFVVWQVYSPEFSLYAYLWLGMNRIPGGPFQMGSTLEEVTDAYAFSDRIGCSFCRKRALFDREFPLRNIRISTFYLDRNEVTNTEFAAWLVKQHNLQFDPQTSEVRIGDVVLINIKPDYGTGGVARVAGKYVPRAGFEHKPVTAVTWDSARWFCAEQGKRLPTEAEWEWAARGPKRYRFPWGDNEPSCEDAVFERRDANSRCRGMASSPEVVGKTSRDRSAQSINDLGGNVAEWVMDDYRARYLPCASTGCFDPRVLGESDDPTEHGQKVVRGGSYYRGAEACRAASRGGLPHWTTYGDVGFRCAISPGNPAKE